MTAAGGSSLAGDQSAQSNIASDRVITSSCNNPVHIHFGIVYYLFSFFARHSNWRERRDDRLIRNIIPLSTKARNKLRTSSRKLREHRLTLRCPYFCCILTFVPHVYHVYHVRVDMHAIIAATFGVICNSLKLRVQDALHVANIFRDINTLRRIITKLWKYYSTDFNVSIKLIFETAPSE